MADPLQRYVSDEYALAHPTWDREDAAWKAGHVRRLLAELRVTPKRMVDVGCGAGDVLAKLRPAFPDAELHGYEIAPAAAQLWREHEVARIDFQVGDFLTAETPRFDVLLLLDVLEHLADPWAYLQKLHGRAEWYVFHFPLDLSAAAVFRERPIMAARRQYGHIHYFTKNLALALVDECAYDVVRLEYSGAAVSGPRMTWRTRVASLPRRAAYAVNRDAGVRLLGGETLFVAARERVQ